jgi:hypothetical protein
LRRLARILWSLLLSPPVWAAMAVMLIGAVFLGNGEYWPNEENENDKDD